MATFTGQLKKQVRVEYEELKDGDVVLGFSPYIVLALETQTMTDPDAFALANALNQMVHSQVNVSIKPGAAKARRRVIWQSSIPPISP